MISKRIYCLLLAVMLVLGSACIVRAAEVDCDAVYCFSSGDFGQEELAGICVTGLPDAEAGTVMLGSRVLRPGDILTAEQLEQMTFVPLRTERDVSASVTYLPVYADHVAASATMTIAIRGKEDKAPIAEDFAAETYKNLPVDGALKVKDPEGQAITYTIVRQPKRGEVTIRDDGTFTYTPRKNKVGIDSFVFTAADPAGNVSRETTVTITIVKPTDSTQYTDTAGKSCRFAAEWMKNTGIFVAETVDGNACFNPGKAVTRGEFLTMLVKTLEIPADEEATASVYTDEIPTWLQPYLAAAIRSGLTAGLPDAETFGADQPVTGGEAAVMLQNALDLSADTEQVMEEESDVPDWAANALKALGANGISLTSEGELTRAQAAEALYQASRLAEDAPGMAVFRRVA